MTLEDTLVTGTIFWQIAALAASLIIVVALLIGVYHSKQTTLSQWQKAMWLKYVRGMEGYRGELREHSDEALQATQRQWYHQLGAAFIGAGIGLLVGTGGSFALAQLALRAPFSLPFALLFLAFLPPFWGMSIGFAGGGIVATQRAAAARRYDATVTTPPISRRVSDYRSPLLTVIVALPAIVYTTLTVLLAPKYTPYFPYDLRVHALIPPPRWILAIFPGALILSVIVVEGCVWARVQAAAGITSPDASLAHGANVLLIAKNVSAIYVPMMVGPSMMGIGVLTLLSSATQSFPIGLYLGIEMFPVLVGYLGLFLASSAEGSRMGGRLTGWPWSRRAARENGAAAARGGGAV